MNKIKNLFSTPKKTVCTLLCALLVIAVIGAITVYAASTMAENSSIGANNALNFACADTGIDPASAENITTEFSYKQGQFVYQVEFIYANTEYEYWIRASDGSVVKKEMGVIIAENTSASETTPQASEFPETSGEELLADSSEATISSKSSPDSTASQSASETKSDASGQISLEDAKTAALSDAGVSASEATFTKEKLDYDDGIAEYEIKFYTSTHEYEYELNAATGAIISRNAEMLKKESQSSSNGNGSYIGIDQAKSIALNHAGFSASEVNFSKAKLENDDGYTLYEVEFYKNGTEYEYVIDAYDGTILEYDMD